MGDLRARIKYEKRYPAVYLGHLDTVRELERGMRRSGWPFMLSRGFNPRIKTSSIPPVSLGYYSNCEYLDVSLDGALRDYHISQLGNSLPAGIKIVSVDIVLASEESINTILQGYRYRVELFCLPPEKVSEPARIRRKGKDFLVIDIFKKEGNIKNPAKFIDRENFRKVTKTDCILKKE